VLLDASSPVLPVSRGTGQAVQPAGERFRRIGGRWSQLGKSRHSLTLQRSTATVNLTSTHLAADPVVPGSIAGRLSG
jgi:hypothetical protein